MWAAVRVGALQGADVGVLTSVMRFAVLPGGTVIKTHPLCSSSCYVPGTSYTLCPAIPALFPDNTTASGLLMEKLRPKDVTPLVQASQLALVELCSSPQPICLQICCFFTLS